MSKAPERIWAISDRRRHWTDEKPAGPSECHSIEYVRKDVHKVILKHSVSGYMEETLAAHRQAENALWARVSELELEVERVRQEAREETLPVAAALAAAISLLERGGKSAAPSDKMFEQMLNDYRKSLSDYRALITKDADNG